MKITTARKNAIIAGDSHYFTGIPCRNGHLVKRITKCGKCTECHRLFQASWRKENIEKAAGYVQSWRERNRQHCRDYTKKWQKLYPEKMRLANENYYAANVKSQRERARHYYRNNPEKCKAASHKRLSRIRETGGCHTSSDLKAIFSAQKGRCAYCRVSLRKLPPRKRHLDHIVPVVAGGRNDPRNLQFCCQTCNQKKSKKDPIVFARQIGKLL